MRNNKGISKSLAAIMIAIIAIAAVSASVYYLMISETEPVNDVVVGVYTYLTGGQAFMGQMWIEGSQLAADEINAQGGITSLGGAKIKLVMYDAGNSVDEATNAMQRLVMLERPSAITSVVVSGHMIPASEITEREKIPVLAACWADSLTDRGFQYYFRTCPRGSLINTNALPGILDVMEEKLGEPITKVAWVHDANPTAASIGVGFLQIAEELSLELVLDETWPSPLVDAAPVVQKIINSDADVAFMVSDYINEIYMIVSKAKEMGLNIPFSNFGTTMLSPAFKTLMGDLTEGIIVISDIGPINSTVAKTAEANFLAKYGGGFMPKDALLAYGSIWTIKEALEIAGSSDPTALRNALASIDITEGPATVLYDHVKFDAKGDNVYAKSFVVQWQGNRIETIWPEEWATAQPAE